MKTRINSNRSRSVIIIRDGNVINFGSMRSSINSRNRSMINGIPGSPPRDLVFRILEDDDFRITEDGNFRILE